MRILFVDRNEVAHLGRARRDKREEFRAAEQELRNIGFELISADVTSLNLHEYIAGANPPGLVAVDATYFDPRMAVAVAAALSRQVPVFIFYTLRRNEPHRPPYGDFRFVAFGPERSLLDKLTFGLDEKAAAGRHTAASPVPLTLLHGRRHES